MTSCPRTPKRGIRILPLIQLQAVVQPQLKKNWEFSVTFFVLALLAFKARLTGGRLMRLIVFPLNFDKTGASTVIAMISANRNKTDDSEAVLDLWQQVLENNTEAFEQIVSKHQSCVSAVAYACIGDFSASEDIAQETFLVAWQTRNTLQDASRLRPWLCGIARNLAKNYLRKSAKQKEYATQLAEQLQGERLGQSSPQLEAAISEEEQQLVWSTLESIPENYREALVLFYREGESISAIAETLEITAGTAKQRLSRGRKLLRDSVSELVGQVLEQSVPGKRFTAAVMTAILGSFASKTASAASFATAGTAVKLTSAAAKTAGVGASAGLAGGLLGGGLGLLGGWLGLWLPAQMAETMEERRIYEKNYKPLFIEGTIFGCVTLVIALLFPTTGIAIGLSCMGVTMAVFITSTVRRSLQMNRELSDVREALDENAELNDTRLQQVTSSLQTKLPIRGELHYRTRTQLLGLPLVEVRSAGSANQKVAGEPAKAWIALGDVAFGRIVAIGHTAVAPIALGGRVTGMLAIGGIATGIVAIGGIAIGILGIGGLGMGVLGAGGLALGWDCFGGLAIAAHAAAGPCAISLQYAAGVVAIAAGHALGNTAIPSNTESLEAIEYMTNMWPTQINQYLQANRWPVFFTTFLVVTASVLPTMIANWKRPKQEQPPTASSKN